MGEGVFGDRAFGESCQINRVCHQLSPWDSSNGSFPGLAVQNFPIGQSLKGQLASSSPRIRVYSSPAAFSEIVQLLRVRLAPAF